MIVKRRQRYEVRSKNGRKKLGSYKSKAEARARLRQIDYFQKRDNKLRAIPEELE